LPLRLSLIFSEFHYLPIFHRYRLFTFSALGIAQF
jgi:hypothetical protein